MAPIGTHQRICLSATIRELTGLPPKAREPRRSGPRRRSLFRSRIRAGNRCRFIISGTFKGNAEPTPSALFQGEPENGQDRARIAELERMVGRLTMELEVAKKASALLPSVPGRSGRSS